MTFASLSLLGKMPVQRDWLIILLSGQETLSVISFNSFDDIWSYPELDLGFNWPIILAISVGLVYWNKKELEQGVFRYESKGALFAVLIERARSGPMLVNYSLNLLAMFWAPDTCSFSLRKYAGNVDLPFFLFNMSFDVSQVFLISPLYLVNSRA